MNPIHNWMKEERLKKLNNKMVEVNTQCPFCRHDSFIDNPLYQIGNECNSIVMKCQKCKKEYNASHKYFNKKLLKQAKPIFKLEDFPPKPKKIKKTDKKTINFPMETYVKQAESIW